MSQPSSTYSSYSSVSIALHWIIALLAFGQIGLMMISDEVSGSERGFWMMLHKSGGMLILALTLVRLLRRLKEPWKPLPVAMTRWQRWLARVTHVGFYVVMIGMPLTGWAAVSAAGSGFDFYGLFPTPLLPVDGGRDTARALFGIHDKGAKVFYVLTALHVAAALKHQYLDKDNELRKMLPFLPDRGRIDPRGPDGAP